MRLAFLADIHGNLPALEAVAADLVQQAPDIVYLAGDQVNRCPWNNEVMDFIVARQWPAIAGNHDLVVGAINTPQNRPPFTEREHFPTLYWTQAQLTDRHLERIRQWPDELCINHEGLPPIRLFHGVPGNTFVGILPEEPDEQISRRLMPIPETTIVCAHTHRPLHRTVNQWTIFNGGSVGIPYNGNPDAQYLLLDGSRTQGWQPTWRSIAYDHSVIPPAFERSGLRASSGPVAELHLRTVMNGEPWISDFGHWLRFQVPHTRANLADAVATYLQQHGPGRWAFDSELSNSSHRQGTHSQVTA
ncbi:MAG: metallophosphoesterase family protein [Caldilineaceae bacterium]|nr:metallophosphoesterase family protein [Caldilineaceae bacterium]